MEKNTELMDAIFGEEEPILPDGWQEGDDLFAEVDQDADSFVTDGSRELTELETENENGTSAAEDPTTVEQGGEEPHGAEGDDDAGASDGEPKAEPAPSRKLKLKVNHREEEIDVAAMSDEDLVSLLQKGRAFDAMKETENKQKFRRVYQEQIDAGMTEAAARMVAQNESGGKSYSLVDEEPPAEPASPVKEPTSVDFKNAWSQLKALDPELKEVPSAVAEAVGKGADPQVAYLKYMMDQSAKTAASLKKENEVLKQNAASAAKAPVRGVTGGGSTAPKKEDNFLKGFDSDEW